MGKIKAKSYFSVNDTRFDGISDSWTLRPFTAICYLTRSVLALKYYLYKKIKRAACFRCRSMMKPQTKRSFCLGVFLVIVTLVVLYSYCNGNSVCYTFPLFSGLDRDRLDKRPQAEVVVTSVIVQTKRPFNMGAIPEQHKGTDDETSVKLSELHTKNEQEVEQENVTDVTEIVEKLHFHRNATSFETYFFSRGGEKDNRTQTKETNEHKIHLLPPSDIIGKVAEEILRKANVSEEEANRELIRVEKVDDIVDREREHRKRLNKQEHSFLEKVKESRGAGGKSTEKKLVRVERVDLTDEEEEEEPEKPVKPAYDPVKPVNDPVKPVNDPVKPVNDPVKPANDPVKPVNDPVKPVNAPAKPVYDHSRTQERAQSNNGSIDDVPKANNSSRMGPVGVISKNDDYEAAHARRFGKTNAVNTTFKSNSSAVKREESHVNKTREELTMTPPPFFAKFLNITAQEREMIDLLHNYTDTSKVRHEGTALNITHQRLGTEQKEPDKIAQRFDVSSAHAHADKVEVRTKRNHKEGDFGDTLQPLIAKLLNLTGDRQEASSTHNDSENLKGPFNLSNILGKITEGDQSLATKDVQSSVPDSTALLVRFLQEGSRYIPRMPKNDTAVHTDKDNSKMAATKLGSKKSDLTPLSGEAINLKETLLKLANHIDLTRHENSSKNQEKNTDLMMLKLLLNQSTLQDFSAFNLSRVLKEITGSSSLKSSLTALAPIKVKRDEDELGSTRAQSDLKIFRPVADKLETSKPELVFNSDRKPSSSLESAGLGALASPNGKASVDRKNNASFSSGSGTGETGDEEFGRSSDTEKRKNRNATAKVQSEKKERSKLGTNGILRYHTIRCEALDPKVLLYNRIFKTGSSTTESIIMNSSASMNYDYQIGTTEDWYDKGRSHTYPRLIIRKANKKLIKYPRMAFVAHFYFRRNLNLPQAHTYINQIRHPVRRLVSHYHYMRSNNRPADRIKEFRASGEKDESLDKCFRLQHRGCKNNVMTRFFCGRHFYCRRGNGRALHKAMNNIKRFYATVGLLEHYDIYLQILHKLLPKFFPKVSNHDIGKFKYNSKYSFNDISKDLIGAITRANWADVKLYSFVKKRFWQQAKACGIRY